MSIELEGVITIVSTAIAHGYMNDDGRERIMELISQPKHYIVWIERKEGEPGIFFYEATCNNKRPIERSNTIKLIKEYVFARLNVMAEILDLPPIKIEQITFIEL